MFHLLPFPFLPSIKHIIVVSLPCSSLGHSECKKEHTLDHPVIIQKKEKVQCSKIYYQGATRARKVHDQKIYDLYYPGAFEIHLHLINDKHMYLCMCSSHLHTVYTQSCVLITALKLFKLIVECLVLGGCYLYDGILYSNANGIMYTV